MLDLRREMEDGAWNEIFRLRFAVNCYEMV